MIKMVATDIDGTILRSDYKFNPSIIAYMKTLEERGIKVVLVTGRMHAATVRIANILGLKTPIVSYQGGMIREGDKILCQNCVDKKYADEILKWANENNVHINLYHNDKLYVENDDFAAHQYSFDRHITYEVKPFCELDFSSGLNKLLAIDFENPENVDKWVEFLSKKYPELYIVKSTPYFCEITNKEAKKSFAVEFLRKYWGIEKEEVLAIGDQNNDIELLKSGGIKVAMGNGTDELKAVADFVTDTVDNDGFIKAVEKFYRSLNV